MKATGLERELDFWTWRFDVGFFLILLLSFVAHKTALLYIIIARTKSQAKN